MWKPSLWQTFSPSPDLTHQWQFLTISKYCSSVKQMVNKTLVLMYLFFNWDKCYVSSKNRHKLPALKKYRWRNGLKQREGEEREGRHTDREGCSSTLIAGQSEKHWSRWRFLTLLHPLRMQEAFHLKQSKYSNMALLLALPVNSRETGFTELIFRGSSFWWDLFHSLPVGKNYKMWNPASQQVCSVSNEIEGKILSRLILL